MKQGFEAKTGNKKTGNRNTDNQEKEKNMDARKIIGIIVASLVLALGLAACGNENNNPDQGVSITETQSEKEEREAKEAGVTPEETRREREERLVREAAVVPGTESDYNPMYKAGDHVDEINAPNGAKAYDEMYYDATTKDLSSRVVIEYRGKIIKIVEPSVNIGFSPDGRYLIYIHNDVAGDFDTDAIFLYDVMTGKSQQLTPYGRKGTEYVPLPKDFDRVRWSENSLIYQARGKIWTLHFKKEEE